MCVQSQELTMSKHLRLIAFCGCIAASVGCDGSLPTAPPPTAPPPTEQPTPPAPPNPNTTVEFGGRVVNADAGDAVGNVRISLGVIAGEPRGWVFPKDTALSGADGTF